MKIVVFILATTLSVGEGLLHFPDYKNHSCIRECVKGQTKTCYYEFTIEVLNTMEPNCIDCPKNETNCFNEHCIVADGIARIIHVYNRMIPGPGIHVCYGDRIILNLTNNLMDQESTIHFHGLYQKGTPFMDGVPMVTQCPVLATTNFIYKFIADKDGTNFYHSHSGLQRDRGAYGALIVRNPVDKNTSLYDYDLPEHTLVISDWFRNDSLVHYNRFYHLKIDEDRTESEFILNGFGTSINNSLPILRFKVKQGFRYRFRVIEAGFMDCAMSFQIQGHNLTVISDDTNEIFEAIEFSDAERVDFVLHANQPVGFYWIKFSGLTRCIGRETIALLEYENAGEPPSRNESSIRLRQRKKLNCINGYLNQTECRFYFQQKGKVQKNDPRLKKIPDFKIYLVYDKYKYARPIYEGVNDSILNNPAINDVIWNTPSRPLIFGEEGLNICNYENRRGCNNTKRFCECTHVVELPYRKTIEIVLIDEAKYKQEPHPVHLHGHHFRVLGQERLNTSITGDYVKELDKKNLLKRNFDYPPTKDTITTPSGGYSIIRFFTDNPGYWYFHCHVSRHLTAGMAMVFKVGDVTRSIPSDFPICGEPTHFGKPFLEKSNKYW